MEFLPGSFHSEMQNRLNAVEGVEGGLQDWAQAVNDALAGLQTESIDWSQITGKPSSFPPSSHAHAISDITSLQASLDAKAAAAHIHSIGDVTGLQTALNGKFANPSGTTAQYIRGDGSLAAFPARTYNNNVSRTLNGNYTISTTNDALVSYSINVSWNIAALLSGSATAFLEYSINSGSSWTTVNQISKNIGLLTFSGADDMNLNGGVPANALVRIRTTATNMTVAYTRGQEILL